MFKVELTKHGQVETIEADNELMTSYVDVKKVDYYDHSKVLPYAGFTMYADAACTKAIKTIKTGKDGIAHFDDIKYGTTVYIKETKAPNGYELSGKVNKVTINDEWLSKEPKDRVIEITNRRIPEIPSTGDNTSFTTYWLLLCISAYFCLTAYKHSPLYKKNS